MLMSCASLAGLVLSFIARFILLVIGPLVGSCISGFTRLITLGDGSAGLLR